MSRANQNPGYPTSGSQKASLIFSGDHAANDEGSFYIATNAAPGTAIATTTSVVDDATGATTHAQQKPVMVVGNQWQVGDVAAQSIYLRYLKMVISQVPTSATAWKYAMRLSPNLGTKVTTAGTVISALCANPAYPTATRAIIQFGAITATDSTTDTGQRLVANGQVSGAIPVANDEWMFTFGDSSKSLDSIGTQTLVKRLTVPCPPICIPPGWIWVLEMWGASNAAAPSWEFEMGYVERPLGQ